jgi:hypothetical protein
VTPLGPSLKSGNKNLEGREKKTESHQKLKRLFTGPKSKVKAQFTHVFFWSLVACYARALPSIRPADSHNDKQRSIGPTAAIMTAHVPFVLFREFSLFLSSHLTSPHTVSFRSAFICQGRNRCRPGPRSGSLTCLCCSLFCRHTSTLSPLSSLWISRPGPMRTS